MHAKVELHADVVKYVCGLSEPDRDDFVKRLTWVRDDPIRRSAAHLEREIRGHMLRRFEFGRGVTRIAIFEYDGDDHRIRVLHCRFANPRRPRSQDN